MDRTSVRWITINCPIFKQKSTKKLYSLLKKTVREVKQLKHDNQLKQATLQQLVDENAILKVKVEKLEQNTLQKISNICTNGSGFYRAYELHVHVLCIAGGY